MRERKQTFLQRTHKSVDDKGTNGRRGHCNPLPTAEHCAELRNKADDAPRVFSGLWLDKSELFGIVYGSSNLLADVLALWISRIVCLNPLKGITPVSSPAKCLISLIRMVICHTSEAFGSWLWKD